MVHKALLTAVSRAHISNAGWCNHEIFLLLLLLRTWLTLVLLLVRLMPLLLVEKGLLACYNQEYS